MHVKAHSPIALRAARRSSRRGLTLVEMGIVIFVMAIMISMLVSMISSMAALKSSEDEGQILKGQLIFARMAALKSNQTVYIKFDIDKNSYYIFRKERKEGKITEKKHKTRKLSSSNSIVGISKGGGARQSSGTVIIPFSPEGSSEELAVYLGPNPEIRATVLYSRYGSHARVEKGEKTVKLTRDTWKDDLEKR